MSGPSPDLVARPLAGRTLSARDDPTFVLEELIDDGSSPGYPLAPLHRHLDEDEAWYVLEGRLVVRVGEDEHSIGPGEAVLGPKRVAHTFWNPDAAPVRYLLVTGPRTARLLASIDRLPSERAAVEALFRHHGIELLG